MARKTLTDKGVAALKPRAQRYAHPDPELRGHYVRVMPSGQKSFVTVARNRKGTQVWSLVGPADAMDIESAREQARTMLQRVRAGLPAREPRAETFGAVAESWRKRHVEKNELRTADEIIRLLDRYVLPTWRDRE